MKLPTTYTYKAIHRFGFYGIKSGEAGTIISDAFEHLNALIDILWISLMKNLSLLVRIHPRFFIVHF